MFAYTYCETIERIKTQRSDFHVPGYRMTIGTQSSYKRRLKGILGRLTSLGLRQAASRNPSTVK